jgi:hypothetical protein
VESKRRGDVYIRVAVVNVSSLKTTPNVSVPEKGESIITINSDP